MHLGDRMTRDQLDRGKAHGEDFWVKVEQAFADETFEEASILKFQDNEHFQDLQVDLSVIIPHNWKKLEKIWKSIHSKYRDACANVGLSGNRNQFHKFCGGRLDVLYLWCCLEWIKPGLKDCVSGLLPEEGQVSSDQPIDEIKPMKSLDAKATPLSAKARCTAGRKRDQEVLRECFLSNPLKKRTVDFMAQDQARKEKEEERAVNEEVRKQQRHTDDQHKRILNEFERVYALIKDLRIQLKDRALTKEEKEDIEADIERLRKKKDELTVLLKY